MKAWTLYDHSAIEWEKGRSSRGIVNPSENCFAAASLSKHSLPPGAVAEKRLARFGSRRRGIVGHPIVVYADNGFYKNELERKHVKGKHSTAILSANSAWAVTVAGRSALPSVTFSAPPHW